MSATAELLRLDHTKSIVPFGDGTNHQFRHSDLDNFGQPTGISIEEVDFLYGLIRLTKPTTVLETGTNIGISASAICLGLRDNGVGHLTTIEHDGTVAAIAQRKMNDMGLGSYCTIRTCEIADYTSEPSLDFLWLDSELNQRYAELVRFFPNMKPGAIACIHDLWSLDWSEFGGVPDELKSLISSGQLRALTFSTSHGVTVFQKRREHDHLSDIVRG